MQPIPTIFVIDDNAMLRALITEQLQKTMPCEVVTFGHADNVLENMESQTPQLIILDYEFELPALKYQNGLQFLSALRAVSNVPVIALSGQNEKEVMANIVKNGANDYIPKEEPQFMTSLMHSVQIILTYKETQRKLKKSAFDVNAQFVVIALVVFAALLGFIFLF